MPTPPIWSTRITCKLSPTRIRSLPDLRQHAGRHGALAPNRRPLYCRRTHERARLARPATASTAAVSFAGAICPSACAAIKRLTNCV